MRQSIFFSMGVDTKALAQVCGLFRDFEYYGIFRQLE